MTHLCFAILCYKYEIAYYSYDLWFWEDKIRPCDFYVTQMQN